MARKYCQQGNRKKQQEALPTLENTKSLMKAAGSGRNKLQLKSNLYSIYVYSQALGILSASVTDHLIDPHNIECYYVNK